MNSRHTNTDTDTHAACMSASPDYLLLTIFTSPISHTANYFGVQLRHYADDIQLYIVLSSTDLSGKVKLQECLCSVLAWFCFKSQAINPDISYAVMFGSRQRLFSLSSHSSIDHASTVVPLSQSGKTFGATLSSNFTFRQHISNL